MDLISFGLGFGAGAFISYTIMQFKYLNSKINLVADNIDSFPTPEEMAKKVLQVKLPMSELPEDLKQQLDEMAAKYKPATPLTPKEIKDMGYLG